MAGAKGKDSNFGLGTFVHDESCTDSRNKSMSIPTSHVLQVKALYLKFE